MSAEKDIDEIAAAIIETTALLDQAVDTLTSISVTVLELADEIAKDTERKD